MKRSYALLGVIVAAITAAASTAAAQGSIHLDQYRPAPTVSDGFAISRPDDRGHLCFGARLDLDYALNPLVVEGTLGSAATERASLVEHQLAANVAVSLGLLERLVLYAGLPVNLVQQGTSAFGQPAGDGPGLGDVLVGARGRLIGEPTDTVALALQLSVALPTGRAANGASHHSGELGAAFHPQLLFEVRPIDALRITANVGARLRTTSPAQLATLSVGHELTWGLGVTVDAIEDVLSLYAEAWGASVLANFGDARARETTPFEALLGARGQVASGFWLGGAVGTGLTRGYGSPDFRGIVTLGYDAGPIRQPPPPELPPTPSDRDRDGLLDDDDSCPDAPEDRDAFEDSDGCPDPDNDADGVPDVSDRCVDIAEDADAFEDSDGCPDPDNDQDTIPDQADRCPLEPEDHDDFQDGDGCPESDNDVDTLVDPEDRCPNEPGPVSEGGCPQSIRLDTAAGVIRIIESIEFEVDRDVLEPSAEAILAEVLGVLQVNTQLTSIRIEGHTDDRNTDEHNLDLSARRARSVLRWLITHGVDGARLHAFGCGEEHPIDTNATRPGRQHNRRVVFQILEPHADGADAEVFGDCREIAP